MGEQQPTLVVGNATGASGLVYEFQVATDSAFSNIIVTGGGIAEGAGSTSWQVNAPLNVGSTYTWRARASGGGLVSPFSSGASFDVAGGFILNQPQNQMLVFDPLTNGTSVGEVSGGEFRDGGWFTTDATSSIRYEVPTITSGYVEFDARGLRTINPTPRPLKRNLLIMWDPSAGDYTENPFRVHITKFDERLVTRWPMRFRWIAAGQESNTGIDLYEWDRNRTYNFRLEWGAFPDVVSSQRARVLLDGREILVRNYDPIYRPSTHWIELGMGPRDETLEQVTYSNVRIGTR